MFEPEALELLAAAGDHPGAARDRWDGQQTAARLCGGGKQRWLFEDAAGLSISETTQLAGCYLEFEGFCDIPRIPFGEPVLSGQTPQRQAWDSPLFRGLLD